VYLETAGARVHKAIDPIAKWLCNIGMYFVVLMVAGVVVDIIMRLLHISVPGLFEAQVLMMIMVTFLSTAYVGVKKGHIAIDVILKKFPPRVQAAFNVANDILAIAILVIIAWRGALYAITNLSQTTAILHIPIAFSMFLVTVGCGFLALVILGDLFLHLSEFAKTHWWPGLVIVVLIPLIFLAAPVWMGWMGASTLLAGIISLLAMVILIFLGLPLAFSLGIAGFIGVAYSSSWGSAFQLAGSVSYNQVADYFLSVVPFFVLMGSLAAVSGISRDLFHTISVWLGRLPGSLAMATVAGGAGFGAVCGDSFATAATMGKVALPEMKKRKYADSLAGASVAVGGTMGIMIPPSVIFIIYAILTEQSVGSLFMAGIFPGLLLAGLVMGMIFFQVKRNPGLAPLGEASSLKEKVVATKGTWAMLVLFALVMGGIYGGFFTPVEAGAVGASGAFVFAVSRKMLSRKNFSVALLDAARICGMLLLIMAGIGMLNASMALSKIPMVMADFVADLTVPHWVILIGILLMYLVFGFIMNIVAVVMLTIPILLPTLIALGFDLIWFGVLIVLVVMIGQLTPPVGVVCFIVKGMAPDMSLGDVFKGVTPLWIALIVGLLIIAFWPQIALFLPNLL